MQCIVQLSYAGFLNLPRTLTLSYFFDLPTVKKKTKSCTSLDENNMSIVSQSEVIIDTYQYSEYPDKVLLWSKHLVFFLIENFDPSFIQHYLMDPLENLLSSIRMYYVVEDIRKCGMGRGERRRGGNRDMGSWQTWGTSSVFSIGHNLAAVCHSSLHISDILGKIYVEI